MTYIRLRRSQVSGHIFLFLGSQKIARYIPERRSIEFKDHHKSGRVVEVTIPDFTSQLTRLVE
jgi:hypothetical protein